METHREDLEAFAKAVLDLAGAIPEGDPRRFGRKVFLAAFEPNKATARLLVEAHREGLIVLSRADLTPAFDPAMVKASLVTYGPAEFHFVTAPRVRMV